MFDEIIRVIFLNEKHKIYHAILLEYDFMFQVNSDLNVGLIYENHKKKIRTVLKDSSEGLEYYCESDSKIFDLDSYTKLEGTFLTESTTNEEMLSRELHILIRIRPNILNNYKRSIQ